MGYEQDEKDWELQAYGCSKVQLEKIIKEQAFPGHELM